jgi:DNA primase
MITDDDVERVLDAADIVAVVGEHVRLKRVGNSWRGPCPFHKGKGDNFSVLPGRGYRCWVCGETGSVFTFVQKQLGLDFVEAVKFVGLKSGVEVRDVRRRVDAPHPHEPLWEVVAATEEFFQRALWEEEEGSIARAYLAQRAITRELADRFGLGYAPHSPSALRNHLTALGMPAERQVAAGVLIQRDGESEGRPRFRGRLTFPIHDARGRPVGFGARALDNSEPKYINSAESAIYSKGSLLYRLHEARHAIRRVDRVLLVEGYFDVLRIVAAGIDEVVAPLGTALTPNQAQLLRRYTRNVFVLYDSDKAGLRATFRSGDALLAERASVRVVTLPEGEDPDTFVLRHGAAGLEKAVRQSLDVFDRKLQLLQRGGWFADLTKARKALDRLLPTIRSTADELTRDLYLTRAAEASGVARDTLVREAAQSPETGRANRGADRVTSATGPAPRRPSRSGGESPARRVRAPGEEAERDIVRVMLIAPDRIDRITELLASIDDEAHSARRHAGHMDAVSPAPAGLRDRRLHAIHQALLACNGNTDPARVVDHLETDAIGLYQDLLSGLDAIVHVEETLGDAVRRLQVRWRRELIGALRARAEGMSDPDQRNAEILRLRKEIEVLT